jgi:imidazole glycerol-phosphate synthase subunit HisF
MLRSRIIPCLLVHKKGLVKTVRFTNPKYVGDPINAVRIFNEKQVDELAVFDIDATAAGREPDYGMIKNLADECRMPLCYGGGVTSAQQATRIVSLGVEKIAISAAAIARPALIAEMADAIGRQSVAVVIDVQKGGLLRSNAVVTHNASRRTKLDPVEFAVEAERLGAGEIVINSVDRDGTMSGYDLELAQRIRNATSVPLTILGGAGSAADMRALLDKIGTAGAAAGSLFVFKGQYKAVLISYARPN